MKNKPKRTIYYHDCKTRGYRILKDNKDESCQFCGTRKWKIFLKIFEKEEKKPSLFEKISERIKR